jgi:hypothetical protein
MKLHIGAVPESAEFEPEAQGWTGLREPNPVMLQLWAMPVAVVNIIVLVMLWNFAHPLTMVIATQPNLVAPVVYTVIAGNMSVTTLQPQLLAIGIGVVLLAFIPVHELLHAFMAPGRGRGEKTIIGVWPERLLFYAHYDGAMPRNRFLLVFFTPFLVLSLLPIVIAVLWNYVTTDATVPLILLSLSLVNGLVACGDILGIAMIWKQVPADALVRNQGWRTFWKIAG